MAHYVVLSCAQKFSLNMFYVLLDMLHDLAEYYKVLLCCFLKWLVHFFILHSYLSLVQSKDPTESRPRGAISNSGRGSRGGAERYVGRGGSGMYMIMYTLF